MIHAPLPSLDLMTRARAQWDALPSAEKQAREQIWERGQGPLGCVYFRRDTNVEFAKFDCRTDLLRQYMLYRAGSKPTQAGDLVYCFDVFDEYEEPGTEPKMRMNVTYWQQEPTRMALRWVRNPVGELARVQFEERDGRVCVVVKYARDFAFPPVTEAIGGAGDPSTLSRTPQDGTESVVADMYEFRERVYTVNGQSHEAMLAAYAQCQRDVLLAREASMAVSEGTIVLFERENDLRLPKFVREHLLQSTFIERKMTENAPPEDTFSTCIELHNDWHEESDSLVLLRFGCGVEDHVWYERSSKLWHLDVNFLDSKTDQWTTKRMRVPSSMHLYEQQFIAV